MFKFKRVKIAYNTRALKKSYVTDALGHISTFIAKGLLGERILDFIGGWHDSVNTRRAENRILRAFHTKKWYIARTMEILAKKYGLDVSKLPAKEKEALSESLVKIVEKNNGKEFVDKLFNEIKTFVQKKGLAKNEKEAKKIIHDLRLTMSEYLIRGIWVGGKDENIALFDMRTNEIITRNGVKRVPLSGSKEDIRKLMEILKRYNIDIKGKYFDIVDSKHIVEALINGRTPREAYEIYKDLTYSRLEKDKIFREQFVERQKQQLMRLYNVAGLFGVFHDVLTTLPSRLVAWISRTLAGIVSSIPIVGSIASINYSAAAAVTEIGEMMSSKLESSSYMWYSLSHAMGNMENMVKDALTRTAQREGLTSIQSGQARAVAG